jgi:two-component system LytT family response regulator
MQQIKVIIIDDEPKARKLLHQLLKENCNQIQVIAECEDLPNGVKNIRKLKPDLIFLDIEMPGHSGLELLDFFNEDEINFGIIFTTAYNQYAIQAFKLSAVDYLLKPIDEEDLINSVERFSKKNIPEKRNFNVLKENLVSDSNKKIAVPIGQSIKFIEIEKIIVLKADNSYTEMVLSTGETLIVSRTLKNFESALPLENDLIRVHKSYLVNKNCITEYVKSDGGYLVLNNKMQIPVSSEKAEELLNNHVMIKRSN